MSLCGTSIADSSDGYDSGAAQLPSGARPKQKPLSALLNRVSKSANNSYVNTTQSDSSTGSVNLSKSRRRRNRSRCKKLPPLGIFWDIENCQVPKARSAAAVVQRIRSLFLKNYREAEFVVVCDVKKENPNIIDELHDAQVNLIHVTSVSKNAADDKLRQSLRRFAEAYPAPAAVVLISGDINFASDLADLRYRKKIRVILVHNLNVADALVLCANEHYCYGSLTEDLPSQKEKGSVGPAFLVVVNLPLQIEARKIKSRLQLLTSNCGGRVSEFSPGDGKATIKFATDDCALRAQRRIQGEDVYGNKIKVLTHSLRGPGNKVRNGGFMGPMPAGFSAAELQMQSASLYQQVSFREQLRSLQQDGSSSASQDSNSFRPICPVVGSSMTPMDVSYEQGWIGRHSMPTDRRPQDSHSTTPISLPSRSHKTSASSDFSDDTKANQPVDLIISNLDSTIDIKELRRLLTNMLKEYVMILSLNVMVHADGTPIANIRVNSQQEAQFAISQLHRQKLGHKRIVISYAQNNNSPDPEQLRAMVISILQEVPDSRMPLFKFIELVESRYHCTVSVSEINKLRDVCKITDDHGSRIISLAQEIKQSPPLNLGQTLVPYCTTHCPNGLQSLGWCELSTIQTPNIMMSLRLFTPKLNSLLQLHSGSMPLLSFQVCYEQEYHEPLPVDDRGVPLEHLITCAPNVEISYVGPNKNIKYIKKEYKCVETDEETVLKIVPPSLAPNISLLCRELVDLLKTTDKCQLLLSKFIPAYHHHFGRQCRVADYGYTKLLDLFESISHVVQIMGDGTRRVITLSHSAQMRRFTSDLLRVLKVQPCKQIAITEFPAAYEKVMNRPFNAVEYGLCTFEDLLEEVPENTIVISKNSEGIIIAVPKREQTAEEIARTKQFAVEVVDLLRHSPYCTMLFNKFVPAYHHHFGHQCKVSDYGFAKLIELFEAIPDVVKIEEMSDGERMVSLTLPQLLRVLGSQIVTLIKNSKMSSVLLDELPGLYIREYGYPLKCQVYECNTVGEVVQQLGEIQIIQSNAGPLLMAAELDSAEVQAIRAWALLLKTPHCKEIEKFQYEYQSTYNGNFSLINLQKLRNVVQISMENDISYISLTSMYVLAAQLYRVLFENGGSVVFSSLDKLYTQCYGRTLSEFNINSVDELYNQFSFLFFVRTVRKRCVISLNRNLSEYLVPLPREIYNTSNGNAPKRDTLQWPPPPLPDMLTGAKKVSPPKPDTPPTPGTAPWGIWSSTFDNLNLSIQLPIVQNPTLLGNTDHLISPARHLLPNRNPWGSVLPVISAPDPTELPMPDRLISKGGVSDDSNDSGVNTKLEHSPSDAEAEVSAHQQFASINSHFATFLDFNN